MQPKIIVVGSANTDLVVQTPRLPRPGETILGGAFVVAQGGKGANQAVAAARLGAQVTLVACLGQDSFGEQSLKAYQAEGIDIRYVRREAGVASGVALILVSEQGENMIAVAPGANAKLSPEDVLAAEEAFVQADCVLLQLEIPLETVQAAAELACRHEVEVILNPAPAARLPDDLLRLVSVLTPNETEAALLAGRDSEKAQGEGAGWYAQEAYRLLSARGVKTMIVTQGGEGATLFTDLEASQHIPGFPVRVVDTVACGDAFNAALAVSLARGASLPEAVRYANAVGALTATRSGAQPSLPTAAEVESFLQP